jgi:hypothetical protein
MSPEQAQGAAATPRSDVFALGIVLHEMLSGRHPFARATVFETLTAIVREDPPPLEGVAGLPSGVARLVERCLEKRPGERPGSAADLAFLLETLGTRVESGPTPATAPVIDPVTRVEFARASRRPAILWAGITVLFVVVTWSYVHVMSDRIVSEATDADLQRVQTTVRRVTADRLSNLQLAARLVASFPELKALFETDTATVRDYLLAYQQRNPGTGILLAFGAGGRPIARTDLATLGGEETWLTELLDAPDAMSVVILAGKPHHAAAAESEARGTVFGYVVAAAPIDADFARVVGEATQDDIVLLGRDQALGTTLRAGQAPWGSLAEWRAQGGRSDTTMHVEVAGRQVAVREVILHREPSVSAVLVKSAEEAIEPYRRIERGIILIGVAAIALAIGVTFWLAGDLRVGSSESGIRS